MKMRMPFPIILLENVGNEKAEMEQNKPGKENLRKKRTEKEHKYQKSLQR